MFTKETRHTIQFICDTKQASILNTSFDIYKLLLYIHFFSRVSFKIKLLQYVKYTQPSDMGFKNVEHHCV